jgi:hypothetical protein
VDAGSAHADTREFLAVVGVAAAGLTLAATAAFVPWHGGAEPAGAVIEVHAPAVVAPDGAAGQR